LRSVASQLTVGLTEPPAGRRPPGDSSGVEWSRVQDFYGRLAGALGLINYLCSPAMSAAQLAMHWINLAKDPIFKY